MQIVVLLVVLLVTVGPLLWNRRKLKRQLREQLECQVEEMMHMAECSPSTILELRKLDINLRASVEVGRDPEFLEIMIARTQGRMGILLRTVDPKDDGYQEFCQAFDKLSDSIRSTRDSSD
jgi:hypothetical protein